MILKVVTTILGLILNLSPRFWKMMQKVCLFALFLVLQTTPIASICCPGTVDPTPATRTCRDGSKVPIFQCCGRGACNVFCCNCDGGCLKSSDDNSTIDNGVPSFDSR